MKTYDVIILGGGIAGLACADELLAKSEKKVLVLEKNSYPGGLAATLKYKNFLHDLSPHRWFTKNDELNIWLDQLIKEDFVWINKNTPMYQMGKFFKYPIKISDVLKKINLFLGFLMVISFLYERIKNRLMPKNPKTMKEAYINRFGYILFKFFNEEFNDKLWGENGCQKMSADFIDQRVKDMSMLNIIMNSLGIGKGKIISLIEKFRYPIYGIGEISEKLEKRIKKNQGEIIYNEEIIKIKREKDFFSVKTKKNVYFCKHLISSIPLPYLVKNIENKIPNNILVSAKKLHFVHQKIVVLFADKEKLTEFTWVYVHPKKIKTFRFLETNNWSLKMSPQNKTSLVFEYPHSRGDEISRISDQELIEITKKDFLKYFATTNISSQNIIDAKVYRVDFAYPKYDLHYLSALKSVKQYLKTNFPNLQIIGRSGMFRYNNMDHSIYTGILAARNLLAGKIVYDLNQVNQEAEYLEEKIL